VAPSGSRPQGTITRGTTNPNRLRRLDRWIAHRMGSARPSGPDRRRPRLRFVRGGFEVPLPDARRPLV